VPALAHRLVLRPELWVRNITSEDIVADLLAEVPTPPTQPVPPPEPVP
jgi:MoxR-like ATPase